MGGAPGLQTNSTQLIVRMIHPAFCGMGGDALRLVEAREHEKLTKQHPNILLNKGMTHLFECHIG
jgi:hypothetical protein